MIRSQQRYFLPERRKVGEKIGKSRFRGRWKRIKGKKVTRKKDRKLSSRRNGLSLVLRKLPEKWKRQRRKSSERPATRTLKTRPKLVKARYLRKVGRKMFSMNLL